ncbi:hypothetical protein SAMN05421764_1278 [Donghicola eburneus]|nr:hypothetical protein SAMN05421764_1278 [Donghicola eburneus]
MSIEVNIASGFKYCGFVLERTALLVSISGQAKPLTRFWRLYTGVKEPRWWIPYEAAGVVSAVEALEVSSASAKACILQLLLLLLRKCQDRRERGKLTNDHLKANTSEARPRFDLMLRGVGRELDCARVCGAASRKRRVFRSRQWGNIADGVRRFGQVQRDQPQPI